MSEKQAKQGVCFFAYNNEQIDYVELATLAALYVKEHLKLPVCLITDEGSEAWLQQSKPELAERCFDYIVLTNDEMKKNKRIHNDSPWTEFVAQFNNSNKHKVFEYTPFEQTILLDIDYIVKSDFLLGCFRQSGVAMFDTALDIRNQQPLSGERFLYESGIKMWWSTVIYFDQSELSKIFFDTWAHVAENYQFYQYLYNFPPKLFRTDYCVSIASHILNGMQDSDVIGKIPTQMINVNQKDDIVEIQDKIKWIMLACDHKKNWKNILVQTNNLDLHVMNKRALGRSYHQLVEMFNE